MSTRQPPSRSDSSTGARSSGAIEREQAARADGPSGGDRVERWPRDRAVEGRDRGVEGGRPVDDPVVGPARPNRVVIPRSRGAISGAVLFVLGIWGAIIPFVGPYFHYAYINYNGFSWPTTGRLWLSIIPGVVAAIAGLELMRSANRPSASIAAMLGVAAGGWFVIGQSVSTLWNHGVSQAGTALGGTFMRMIEQLGYFYLLGAVILFFSAMALGRLSVITLRDLRAQRRRYGGGRYSETDRRYDESGRYSESPPPQMDPTQPRM